MRCTKLNWEYKNAIDKESEKIKEDFILQNKNNFAIIENKNDEIQKINTRFCESQRIITDQRNCQIYALEKENECKLLLKEKDQLIKEKEESFINMQNKINNINKMHEVEKKDIEDEVKKT